MIRFAELTNSNGGVELAHKPRSRSGKQSERVQVYLDSMTIRRLTRFAEGVDLTDGGAARYLIEEGLDRRQIRDPEVETAAVPA